MSDMLARATAAASNAWHECETCPGEMYVKEARIVARAALLAALDPEDRELVRLVARHICTKVEIGKFQNPDELEVVSEGGDKDPIWMAHVDEAVAAIEALKSVAQGETR